MAYVALSSLCHESYNCDVGKVLIGCPPKLLQQFIADGVVKLQAPEASSGATSLFDDQDALSDMTIPQLLEVIKKNNLRGMVNPMSDWSIQKIRQSIRDCFPVANLILPVTE